MVTEQYVSFETAKLLKGAGFDIPCRGIYRTDRTGDYAFRECDRKQTTDDLSWNSSDGFQYEYLAPTQALAARWLREVHGIAADASFIPLKREKNWQFFIGNMGDMVWAGDFRVSVHLYETYEQAVEKALQEALQLIIKNKEDERGNDK